MLLIAMPVWQAVVFLQMLSGCAALPEFPLSIYGLANSAASHDHTTLMQRKIWYPSFPTYAISSNNLWRGSW